MGYRMMGRAHADLHHLLGRLGDQRGQGTVEYVALVLLVAAVMAAVVGASSNKSQAEGIAKSITEKLKSAIEGMKVKS
jgi:hypothetical protein